MTEKSKSIIPDVLWTDDGEGKILNVCVPENREDLIRVIDFLKDRFPHYVVKSMLDYHIKNWNEFNEINIYLDPTFRAIDIFEKAGPYLYNGKRTMIALLRSEDYIKSFTD